MAVDQNAMAEALDRLVDQLAQGLVVGQIKLLYAPFGLGEGKLAAINLGA